MMLELAAQRGEIEIAEPEDSSIADEYYAMRIAHRDRGDLLELSGDVERIVDDAAVGIDGNLAALENRLAHIHRRGDHLAARELQRHGFQPGVSLDHHRIRAHETALESEPREASDSV